MKVLTLHLFSILDMFIIHFFHLYYTVLNSSYPYISTKVNYKTNSLLQILFNDSLCDITIKIHPCSSTYFLNWLSELSHFLHQNRLLPHPILIFEAFAKQYVLTQVAAFVPLINFSIFTNLIIQSHLL